VGKLTRVVTDSGVGVAVLEWFAVNN